MDPATIEFVLLGLSFLFSAFFSSSEIAFMRANRIRLERYADEGKSTALQVVNMLGNVPRLLSTILVGNNIANTLATAIATALLLRLFPNEEGRAIALATVIVTAMLVIWGEIVPKTIAAARAERTSMLFSFPLTWAGVILWPAVRLVELATVPIVAFLQPKGDDAEPEFSAEEIQTIIHRGAEEGAIEQAHGQWLQRILGLSEREARTIMTPRVDMIAASEETGLEETLEKMIEEGVSRLPLYRSSVDEIVGVVYLKDLVLSLRQDGEAAPTSLSGIMRVVEHIPGTKPVDSLLSEMVVKGNQLVILTDEYGGTLGLVTLEDVLEEIVGEIRDEHDRVLRRVVLGDDGNTATVTGRATLEELEEVMGVELDRSQYRTIQGLFSHHKNKIPKPGTEVIIDTLCFRVEALEGPFIRRATVEKRAQQPEEEKKDPDPQNEE